MAYIEYLDTPGPFIPFPVSGVKHKYRLRKKQARREAQEKLEKQRKEEEDSENSASSG